MEEYGPGEEALRAAAAAAASREGNPEKLRGVRGMNPPPSVYLLLKYLSITPSSPWIFQTLIIFVTSPSLITSQEDSDQSARSTPTLSTSTPSHCLLFLSWSTPVSVVFAFAPSEVLVSSFSLHLLCHSRTSDFLSSSAPLSHLVFKTWLNWDTDSKLGSCNLLSL